MKRENEEIIETIKRLKHLLDFCNEELEAKHGCFDIKDKKALEKSIIIIEKQATELNYLHDIMIKRGEQMVYEEMYNDMKKLADKQEKEIEELKDSNNKLYSILQENKKQTKYSLENNDKKWEDKIKAKLEQIYKEYQEILSNEKRNLYEKNIATFQHGAMRTVLEELLKEE